MTLVSGPLSTVTTTPSAVSQVNVSINSPRTQGTGVMTPEVKTVAVTGGDFSSQIAPGPAVLSLLIGGRESAPIPILVDDVASQTLAEVVEAARLATGETQESLAQFLQQVLGAANDVATAKSAALAEIDGEVQRAIDESAQTTIDTVVVPAIEGARDEALGQVTGAVAAELDYFEERMVPTVEQPPQNLVDPDEAVYGLIAPDGLIFDHATNQVTGWIPVAPGAQYVSWSSEVSSTGGHRLVFFDEAKAVIPGGDTSYKPGRTTHQWGAPPTAAYVRIGVSPMPPTPTPIDQVLIFHEGTTLWDPDAPMDRSWWEDKITPPPTPVSVEDLDFSVGGKIPYGMVLMSVEDLQAMREMITAEAMAVLEDALAGHYGGTALTYPEGFAAVPVDLRQHADGRITHRFDFRPYQNAETHIWYDSTATTTGTGTKSDPYRLWPTTLRAAEAAPGDVVIHVASPINRRSSTTSSSGLVVDGKRVSIISEGDFAWMTAANETLSWTQDGTVWSAPRSAVRSVFLTEQDEHGIPIPLHSAATLDECRTTPDSWWADSSTVYISSTVAPTVDTHHVCIAVAAFGEVTIRNGGTLYMENIGILQGNVVNFRGDATGSAIFNGCKFVGGDLRNQATGIFGNGLNILDISRTLSFDCIAAHNPRDGFNYHYANTPVEQRRECLAFEYDCLAYGLGPYNSESNNNATTAHEGISVLRVGTVGREMSGPALADVGGCLSVNYNCHMEDGTRNYVFEAGEAWLHDCISRSPVIDHVLLTQDAILHGDIGVPLPTRSPLHLAYTGTGTPLLGNFLDAQIGDYIVRKSDGQEWRVDA